MLWTVFTKYLSKERKFFVFPHCAEYSQIISVRYIIKAIPYLTLPSLLQLAMAFLREKKIIFEKKKKREKKISGNFRASHCVRNKGLCYIFFAFFRKALGNTFSTLTRKKGFKNAVFCYKWNAADEYGPLFF